MGAQDQLAGRAHQRLRRRLPGVVVDVDDVTDLVDEQAHGPVVGAQHHVHGPAAVRGLRQGEALAKLDRGDDLAAQVDEPGHRPGGERDGGHVLVPDDLLDPCDVDAEPQPVDDEGGVLLGHEDGPPVMRG